MPQFQPYKLNTHMHSFIEIQLKKWQKEQI